MVILAHGLEGSTWPYRLIALQAQHGSTGNMALQAHSFTGSTWLYRLNMTPMA